MAITNTSEVKFVYTSDYNNLSDDNKSTYADAIIFDEATRGILLDGKTFGGSASSDNTVLVTQDNWLNPEIWGASATPGTHYIIRDLLTYSGTDTIELELPNNSTIEFLKGAGLGSDDIANTRTFTFKLNHADIISPKQKIFYLSCTLIGFIFNEYIPIEWFGAVGCDVTADENLANHLAVLNAIDHAGGGTVLMSDPYYAFSTNIIIPARLTNYPILEYEISKGTDISCLRKKLLCLGNIVPTANYNVNGGYIINGNLRFKTKAAIAIVHPYTDIEVRGSILISGEIYDDDFAAVTIYCANTMGYDGNNKLDDLQFLNYFKPNCNIYVNTIVKGIYNTDLTYNDRMMVRSWISQQALNCGTGTGIYIESASNSNIKVDNIRGFNKAVDIFCMHNSTLTVSNIICNYGIYVHYTPYITDSASGITNIEPLVTGNTINYNGVTSGNINNYMYVPSDPIYTYDETTDPNHMYPTGISGFTMKNDATLFKVYKNCIYADGVTPVDDPKILFARNTININNLGGFWSMLIDGIYMYNNTFNIKGNYFDAKIIRNDEGTSSDPDPDLDPTYTVTNENTGFNVINSSYCSICCVNAFVTTEKSTNNIINSYSPFPYDLVTSINGELIINNCAPLDSLTALLDATLTISIPSDTGNPFYINYKSCEAVNNTGPSTLYIIQPSIKPEIFDSSLDFNSGDSYEGIQLVTTDTSTWYKAKKLYPLYEGTSATPRRWYNTYYYDEYGLVETYKINSILEQINGR